MELLRDVVSTGPLARGHLIWPLGQLLLDSTGPDWPPKFRVPTASGNQGKLEGIFPVREFEFFFQKSGNFDDPVFYILVTKYNNL